MAINIEAVDLIIPNQQDCNENDEPDDSNTVKNVYKIFDIDKLPWPLPRTD